ncbi:unnamed protein product [Cochlearia groenlandica]
MMQMLKLPSEMKEEILYRLPLKSLAKLRCVCKLFNTMILDERFIFKNLSHPCKQQHGINDQLIISHDRYLSSMIINDDECSPSLMIIKDLTLMKGHPILGLIKWNSLLYIGLRRRRGGGGGGGGGGDDHHLTAFLQSFDFRKEKFQPIDGLPPFLYDELNPIALEIYKRDHISLLEHCHVTRKICIWFKSRLSSPWTILMVVAIPHFPKLHPLSSRVSTSYFIDDKNRLVITCLELDIGPIQIYKVVGNEFAAYRKQMVLLGDIFRSRATTIRV